MLPAISVCLCTYKRPELLLRLLHGIEGQRTEGLFTFSVVIVDNDRLESAYPVVTSFSRNSTLTLAYDCEPDQNISLARNRAIRLAEGQFIAFIDDDECPRDDWLLNLLKTTRAFSCDGVLGPVIAQFEDNPPKWVLRSGLFERDRFPTGTLLAALHTRTGNVLFRKTLFNDLIVPFDPRLGRTGGEDSDFFCRMISAGRTFVWCDEAPVYESVKENRYKRAFMIRRALLRGISRAKFSSLEDVGVLKSLASAVIYTLALPYLALMGQHVFMSYLIKDCDHIGKLLALCGLEIIKARDPS